MTVLYYLVCGAAAVLGLAAAWLSGRDVGYRNAMREAELLDEENTEILHNDQEKGEKT